MISKKILWSLLTLFCFSFITINSEVCRTQEGVAWCNGVLAIIELVQNSQLNIVGLLLQMVL